MIDQRSKKFIKWLSAQPEHRYLYFDECPDEFGEQDEFFAMVRFLDSKGLVDIVKNQNDLHVGVCLTHIAIHGKEFKFIAIAEYIKDKWVSILALIISILSFIGAYRKELASIVKAIMK